MFVRIVDVWSVWPLDWPITAMNGMDMDIEEEEGEDGEAEEEEDAVVPGGMVVDTSLVVVFQQFTKLLMKWNPILFEVVN